MHEYWKLIRMKAVQYSLLARQVLVKCYAFAFKKFNEYWQQICTNFQSNLPFIKDRLNQYALLTRLNKPIGTFLLLWPTLWALWIAAEGFPNLHVFIVFFMGVFLMRSGGCVLNDFADRGFDAEVKRTRTRPIAAGNVTPGEALCVAATFIIIAFLLVLTLNRLTVQLSVVGIILAAIYPFMKRYTYLPQFFLGLAFGWGIPMAFAAQTNTVPQIAWLLLIANILWSVAYDTIYAMVDRDDDLRIGIKSTAILFDDADRVIIGGIQILVIIVLVLTGRQLELGVYYLGGVFIACALSIYQQYLIRNREREGCMRAFLNNNWFGAVIFMGIFFNYLF